MSYPILYSATETNFDHNGIGILSACVSCEVTEEANGIFEMTLLYPMDGIHFENIECRSIIKSKADQFREPQLFRVYEISKPIHGIVTVLCEHISYDLCGIPVVPYSAENAPAALLGLKQNAVVDCPFDFWTDKQDVAKFKTSVPGSIRSKLGGADESILSVYQGEYEFDNYIVKLHNNRGRNRGVSIRYGKNLTDMVQSQNCSNVVTGVYPYWYVESDAGDLLIDLPEKVVSAHGSYSFSRILTLDLSSDFEVQPTEEELRQKAREYMEQNNVGVPQVSMTVSFAQLEQSEEYKNTKLLEQVGLFDVVNVEFPQLSVSATAKANKIVYDALLDRVKSVTLGSVKASIADTFAKQQKEIKKIPTKTDLERAKEAATEWLTNGKGYKVERRSEDGTVIDTLYMDTPDIETAANILRIGQSGIGFSHNGVNGPYNSAWTIDGNFVADFITSGILNAALVDVVNINADNITTGKIKADRIDTDSLVAKKLVSEWETEKLSINSAYISFYDSQNENFSEFGIGFLGMQTAPDKTFPKLKFTMNPVNAVLLANDVDSARLWTYDPISNEFYIRMGKYVWLYKDGMYEEINSDCHWEYVDSLGKTILVKE